MKKHFLFIFLISLVLGSQNLYAQGSYDLISLETKKFLGQFSIIPGSAKKITDRQGYDNQPFFINDDQMVFSSSDEKGNFDIFLYSFESGKFTNMTRTSTKNEYSPLLTDCGKYISAVTVEEDNSKRLWLYPINFGEPELLYDDIEPVNYYDWYNNIAAMNIEGEPNKLIYPRSRENVVTLAENVGRSIQKRPKTSQVTFLDKGANVVINGKDTYEIKAYDLEENVQSNFGVALSGAVDFIWLDKNTLLMARDQELFIKKIKKSQDWVKIAKVTMPGYGAISRMAISPKSNRLVLVMERNEKE
ncbi:hypothetical protein QWY93_15755 [Echinicola jeungdonensis]|uniref:TolB family protein n=1 Tax=Echinicola jeungdonensis TaxID=709343 RepID=A0ABV5J702_9BACT|nr:hypothetical protein [Echinicola jeungdonensis]MDN3670776.1 hypothetical protein [Echinicola jeungdonensis]